MRKPLSSLEQADMERLYPYYGAASLMDYVDDYIFDGIYGLIGEDGTVIDDNGYPTVTLGDVYKEVLEQAENFKKYAE